MLSMHFEGRSHRYLLIPLPSRSHVKTGKHVGCALVGRPTYPRHLYSPCCWSAQVIAAMRLASMAVLSFAPVMLNIFAVAFKTIIEQAYRDEICHSLTASYNDLSANAFE